MKARAGSLTLLYRRAMGAAVPHLWRSLILGELVVTGLVGCSKPDGVAPSAAPSAVASTRRAESAAVRPTASSASAGATEAEADAALGQKLNYYLECLNGLSNSMRMSRARYLSWADEAKGPKLAGAATGLGDIKDADRCRQALALASRVSPQLPELDPTITAYQEAAREAFLLNRQAYVYYQDGAYKKDKLAEGKAKHAPLMAAYAQFFEASKAFETQVLALSDTLTQRTLARLAGDPSKRLQYLVKKSQLEARGLLDASQVQALEQMDPASYAALVEAFGKTVTELESHAASHSEEADNTVGANAFRMAAQALAKQAREVSEQRAKHQVTRQGSAPGNGYPAHFVEIYNGFVDAANAVQFK